MAKKNIKIRDLELTHRINFIGEKDVWVDVPLTVGERLDLGSEQAKTLAESKNLEMELKDISDKMKGTIKNLSIEAHALARQLNKGTKEVKKSVPCFFDSRENARVYIDMETGEILSRKKAEEGDAQMRLQMEEAIAESFENLDQENVSEH